MTDEYYRIINRAIAHLDHRGNAEFQDLREAARTALHHIFGREKKLREDLEDMTRDRDNLVVREGEALDENARLRETERKLIGDTNFLGKRLAEMDDELTRLREANKAILKANEDYIQINLGLGDELTRLREVEGEPREHWANGHRWPCDGYYNTADRDSLVCECAAIAEVEGE